MRLEFAETKCAESDTVVKLRLNQSMTWKVEKIFKLILDAKPDQSINRRNGVIFFEIWPIKIADLFFARFDSTPESNEKNLALQKQCLFIL